MPARIQALCLILLAFAATAICAATPSNAPALPASASAVWVSNVLDGDTVQLADGRRVRLLGINTPEIQHANRAAEAGGNAAKQWLLQKILHRPVSLVGDVEATDKYGRTLAYVFTQDNELINQQLLAQGLATLNLYPPNLQFATVLENAQQQAEHQQVGIWQRPEYAPISISAIETLAATDESLSQRWLRVHGRLQAIRHTAKSVYLEFTPHLHARIDRQWLALFPDVQHYQGKTLELRGWLHAHHGQFSLLLRHPSAIKIIAP